MKKQVAVALASVGVMAVPFLAYATSGSNPQTTMSGEGHMKFSGSFTPPSGAPSMPSLPSGGSGSDPLSQLKDGLQKGQQNFQDQLSKLQPSSPGTSNPSTPSPAPSNPFDSGKQQLEKAVNDLKSKLQNGMPAAPTPPASDSPANGKIAGSGGGSLTLPGVGTFSMNMSGEGSSSQAPKLSLELKSPHSEPIKIGN